ncbi:unnamed protein product [Bursaphelenchus okinawaensis]|uniref:Uncharacterized protein n=1 Tax=Bursaphelenchus okinawaensis TaxID=465554 RepID=A0A811L6X6_9BILA|nr:unnamed protein product [Bursaphelenchus okinawaensis]CAG9119287.1 unnamed protein product [Bursaphelenchus okinawaensis]
MVELTSNGKGSLELMSSTPFFIIMKISHTVNVTINKTECCLLPFGAVKINCSVKKDIEKAMLEVTWEFTDYFCSYPGESLRKRRHLYHNIVRFCQTEEHFENTSHIKPKLVYNSVNDVFMTGCQNSIGNMNVN